ncbi:Ribosomal-protein-S18p-alanine acetyltransferase, partial [Salmonella enterica subsp. enterica serovar Adelaide str. A4-669]
RRHAPHYGNKSANMNTISILSTTDLPAAWQIEQRAHAFPWSEKTFVFRQPGRTVKNVFRQPGRTVSQP